MAEAIERGAGDRLAGAISPKRPLGVATGICRGRNKVLARVALRPSGDELGQGFPIDYGGALAVEVGKLDSRLRLEQRLCCIHVFRLDARFRERGAQTVFDQKFVVHTLLSLQRSGQLLQFLFVARFHLLSQLGNVALFLGLLSLGGFPRGLDLVELGFQRGKLVILRLELAQQLVILGFQARRSFGHSIVIAAGAGVVRLFGHFGMASP